MPAGRVHRVWRCPVAAGIVRRGRQPAPRFGSLSRVVLAMSGVRLACLARLIRCAHPFGAACRQSVSLRSALALRTVTDRRGAPSPPAPNRSRHRTNGRPNGFPSAASDAIFVTASATHQAEGAAGVLAACQRLGVRVFASSATLSGCADASCGSTSSR